MIERHHDLETLALEWDALADEVDAPPFVRPGWIAAWIDAFGRGRTIVLGVRRQGRLVGVLPLLAVRGGLHSPTNSHTPVFDLLARDPEAASELVNGVLSLGSHRLDLAFLDPCDHGYAAWQAGAARRGHRTIAWEVARAPYVSLEGGWPAYRESLERKFRKELGRLGRRLEGVGRVQFVVDEGSADWPNLLEEGLAIEGSGWKQEAGTAILSRPETARFYRQVAAWAAERGWLRLKFLRLDGRAAAFDLAMEASGASHVLKGGFDTELRNLGPGMVLTERSIKRAFELGLSTYELHGTDDAYKLRWTSTTRARVKTQAFPRSVAGTLTYLAFDRGRRVRRRALRATG